jgi:hypothetical protein
MKITIEAEVATPAGLLAVLSALKGWLMREFNPHEWKRPEMYEVVLTENRISVKVRVGEKQ